MSKNPKHLELLHDLSCFYSADTAQKRIVELGEKIVVLLYSGISNFKLNEKWNNLRFSLFKKNIKNKTFTLAKLPPTEAAASQHSLRVHAQILKWQLKTIDLTKYGWEIKDDMLGPVQLEKNQKLIPDDILKDISCKCTKVCKKKCGCVKHGLKCSEFCVNCFGKNCSNCETPVVPSNVSLDELSDDFESDEAFIMIQMYYMKFYTVIIMLRVQVTLKMAVMPEETILIPIPMMTALTVIILLVAMNIILKKFHNRKGN